MDFPNQPQNFRRLSRLILNYLLENPDAKDTLEGVGKWWINQIESENARIEVQKTLDHLVSLQWVTARSTTRSQTLYGLNKLLINEIKTFLDQDKKTIFP